jgi:DNA-binding NarL/FixJ family response regulator
MKTVKILIADDHKLFRVGLRQIIDAKNGMRVVAEAATGLEAVAKAHEASPDIVLMDISMPELSGLEAMRRIVDELPDVRVIILSMHSDRRYIQEALRAGAKGFLLKDSAPEELLRAIHKALRDQIVLSAKINAVVLESFVQHSPADESSPFRTLSAREREVLQLLAEGKSTREIADRLNLSIKTVETHRQHVMDKLDIHTIAELTRFAIREGLSPLD